MKRVLIVPFLLAAAACLLRMCLKPLGYDEVSHAHCAWLVAHGAIPYRDFAMNHLPFFWFTVSPVLRLVPESFNGVLALRGVAVAGHILFLFFTALAFSRAAADGGKTAQLEIAFLLLPAALWAAMTDFLVEFRPDAIGDPLVFGALCIWPAGRRSGPWRAAVAGLLAGIGILVNTKYMLLPQIVALVVAIQGRPTRRGALACAAAFVAGMFTAALAGTGLLVAKGVDIGTAMVHTFRYEAAFAAQAGHPLVPAMLAYPYAFAVAAVAAVVCAAGMVSRLVPRHPLAVAGLLFLVVQAFVASRPWRQYTMTWLLLAYALGASALVGGWPMPRVAWVWAGAAAALIGIAVEHKALVNQEAPLLFDAGGRSVTLSTQRAASDFMLAHVPRDGRVVAPFPWHPVFRSNSLYKVFSDYSRGADVYIAVRAESHSPAAADIVPFRQLDEHPPDAIFLGLVTDGRVAFSPYDPLLALAVDRYLQEHAGDFDIEVAPGGATAVAVRHPVRD